MLFACSRGCRFKAASDILTEMGDPEVWQRGQVELYEAEEVISLRTRVRLYHPGMCRDPGTRPRFGEDGGLGEAEPGWVAGLRACVGKAEALQGAVWMWAGLALGLSQAPHTLGDVRNAV